MTVKELIDIVDGIKPNQYGIEDKVRWLSFVEHTIINDVIMAYEGYEGQYDDFEGYSPDKLDVPLIVKPPHDRLYEAYLKMKIDEENGETARYNNSATMYNTYLMEYKKWYNKNRMVNCSANRRTAPAPSMPPARPPQAEPMDKEAIKQIEENKTSIQKLRQSLTNEVVTRENAVANERKARESADSIERAERLREIAVERARINAFTRLGEGSTTGDAELNDARVDKDGNIHANAGEHIRSVTGQLSSEIVNLDNSVENLSYPFSLIDNNVIVGSTGVRETNVNYKCSDYIKIFSSDFLYIYSTEDTWGNAFYEADGTYISGFHLIVGENKIEIPSNAKLYRISGTNEHIVNTTIYVGGFVKVKQEIYETMDFVTPQMFGAMGDGVHDDTTAIQEAINSGCKRIIIPSTSEFYRITSPIIINEYGLSIEGSGRETYSEDNLPLIKATESMYQVFYLQENSSFVKITNLKIDCNNLSNAGVFHKADDTFINDLLFECVFVTNAIDYGFYLGAVYKSTFLNLRTLNGRVGFVVLGNTSNNYASTSCVFVNCYSDYASERGFSFTNIIYSSLITCCCDHTNIAYSFKNTKGVSITGCGCEHIKTPLFFDTDSQNVAININSFTAMFLEEDAEYDAIIYCNQIQNMVVSGLCLVDNVRTYDIYSTKPLATICVLDSSVNPQKCHTPNNSIRFPYLGVVYGDESPKFEGQINVNNGVPYISVLETDQLIWKPLQLRE